MLLAPVGLRIMTGLPSLAGSCRRLREASHGLMANCPFACDPMPSYFDVLFAKIALRNKLVTEERIKECFRIQSQASEVGYEESLPAIFMKRGYLTGDQIRKLEKAQAIAQFIKSERTFGRIAVGRGLVTEPVVHEVLEESRNEGGRGFKPGRPGNQEAFPGQREQRRHRDTQHIRQTEWMMSPIVHEREQAP